MSGCDHQQSEAVIGERAKPSSSVVFQGASMAGAGYREYGFPDACPSHMHVKFMRYVLALSGKIGAGTRVLDVGCGNGFVCGRYLALGCHVVGIDMSVQGISMARQVYPQGRFEVLPADGAILANLAEDPFDIVVSTEVVEHLYSPREYARGCYDALRAGGRFICTSPYHGYLKNLAISLAGKWDSHANPLWDGGHIKLWSRRTLTRLLEETGFRAIQFRGIGRFPGLWMTMALCGDKPGG